MPMKTQIKKAGREVLVEPAAGPGRAHVSTERASSPGHRPLGYRRWVPASFAPIPR